MSVKAGSIVLVAGNNVVDRVQSHGLGDVRVPVDVVRETGNDHVVDKVPTEPDFTFSIESWDVTTELEAFLHGKVSGSAATASAAGPGADQPEGTEYKWSDCQMVNIASPWKDPATGSAGVVNAGHLIPGFYPTRVRYRFGVTDAATQEAEVAGGSFYYGKFAPVEEVFTANGSQTAFPTSSAAVNYRQGGAEGTTFKAVFGVIVNGVLQIADSDYTLSGGAVGPSGSVATVTFAVAPATNAQVRFCYFTAAAQSWPDPVHASTLVKPGQVRGRNICVSIASGSNAWQKIASTQSFELEATVEGEVEREFCNEDIIGRVINGTDTNGQITVRARDAAALFTLLKRFTGVDTDTEVLGWLNLNTVRLKCEIQNPKNPAQILKTLYVSDAKFQVPGTPARVNTATDFVVRYESNSGDHSVFKGAMAS